MPKLWEILLDRWFYLQYMTNENEIPTFGLKPERIKSRTKSVQRDTEIQDQVNLFQS